MTDTSEDATDHHSSDPPQPPDDRNAAPWGPTVTEAFVGFVDVLGFGDLILRDFESALNTYEQFLNRVGLMIPLQPDVRLKIYSDSIILVSPNLIALVQAIQSLNFMTLTADCLVRGGVGFGLHAEQEQGVDTLVVSQALTRAVEAERSVGHPCVALHPSVRLEPWVWLNDEDTFVRPILYFEGAQFVNPFSLFWGTSAQYRVTELRKHYPEYSAKYDWFLRLFDAVWDRQYERLVPPDYISLVQRTGI